jgi:formylmethanofuran dehydrogenase subunit B
MRDAWIEGRSVALGAAVAEAARLLGLSRLPVIAGLGTDVRGARAAVALAEAIGGVVDHMHSTALLRDLDVMREAGLMATTQSEAALRADTVLLVGEAIAAWPEFAEHHPGREVAEGFVRRIYWVGLEKQEPDVPRDVVLRLVGRDTAAVPVLLAALRARVGARSVVGPPAFLGTIDALAAQLQSARFGVAVWSALELDALTIEMLCGLVDDLNARTRFTGLPLAAGDNACGVLQACGWMTGLPVRTGFGRGFPEHDPWRHDARRLIEDGEADCAVWICAYRAARPPWRRDVPLIALTTATAQFETPPHVRITVGHPGRDHDCIEYCAASGTLAAVPATNPREVIEVADALAHVAASLPGIRARPC